MGRSGRFRHLGIGSRANKIPCPCTIGVLTTCNERIRVVRRNMLSYKGNITQQGRTRSEKYPNLLFALHEFIWTCPFPSYRFKQFMASFSFSCTSFQHKDLPAWSFQHIFAESFSRQTIASAMSAWGNYTPGAANSYGDKGKGKGKNIWTLPLARTCFEVSFLFHFSCFSLKDGIPRHN